MYNDALNCKYFYSLKKKNHINAGIFNTFYSSTLKMYWAPNQYISLISEGSCNTEDWNNTCWKFSFSSQE